LGLGKPIDPRIGHYHHDKRIIKPNENVDVFFHTWSTEFEDMLVDIYKPKKHIAEKQILFNPDSVGKNSIPSRWWSNATVMKLKRSYEEEMGFKYDWVMLYRFDHIFLVDLLFKNLDNRFMYFRHTNGLRAPAEYSHGYEGREDVTIKEVNTVLDYKMYSCLVILKIWMLFLRCTSIIKKLINLF
jgi:hypothetical protein